MKSLLRRLTIKLLFFLDCVKRPNRKNLGKIGEILAYRYLKRHGYAILQRNYSTAMGEIDIIAEDRDTLVFVEVKMRRSDTYGFPYEAINPKKMKKLTMLARLYIKSKNLYNRKARFDIVSILRQGRSGKKSIRLIKNAFRVTE